MADTADPIVKADVHGKLIAAKEAERRSRFLDARARTIGIDKAALDAQVAEKRAKAAAEREEEKQWADFNGAVGELARTHEVEANDEAVRRANELRTTWRVQRDPHIRDTYDLSDPEALKHDKPARVGDDDPRCGASSMQKFDGEDLSKAERDAKLAADTSAVLDQQVRMAAERAAREKEEDLRYAEFQKQLADMLAEQEAVSTHDKLYDRLKLQQENLAAARARRIAARAAAAEEERRSLAELERARADPMLCEDRGAGVSALGEHRVRRDHFKGMSQEALAAIRATQEEQRRVAAEAKAKAEAEDKAFAAGMLAACDFAVEAEREMAMEKAASQAAYVRELKMQQRADRIRKKAEDEERRNAGIDKEWFKGWNKTSNI